MILRAAIAAAAVLLPSLSTAEVNLLRYTSTVVAVDAKTNTLVFADRSRTLVDKSTPVNIALIGKTVEITQSGDEDGGQPATAVRVLN